MDKTKCVAALFDFDGVVMDTESQYSIFWNEVGKKYHPEYEEFGKIIKGQTLQQIYDRYFQGMEHEEKKAQRNDTKERRFSEKDNRSGESASDRTK